MQGIIQRMALWTENAQDDFVMWEIKKMSHSNSLTFWTFTSAVP